MNKILASLLIIFSLQSFAQDEEYEVLNQASIENTEEQIETVRFENELKYLEKIEDNILSDASDTVIEDQVSTHKSAVERSPSIENNDPSDSFVQEFAPPQKIRRIRSR